MSNDKRTMEQARGAIILCDNFYRDQFGKYVISGTYTIRKCNHQVLHLQDGLKAYARFFVEHAGTHKAVVKLINRMEASNAEPLGNFELDIEVRDPLAPIELGIVFPPCMIECPKKIDEIEAGTYEAIDFLVWLEVDGQALASSPLRVAFINPKQGG